MTDKIDELSKRRDKLLEELELITQYLKLHAKLFPDEPVESAKNGAGTFELVLTPPDRKKGNDPAALARRLQLILQQSPAPLKRGELLKRLEDSGMLIVSKSKAKYLGTLLWRNSDTFVNIEGKGYWTKSQIDREATLTKMLE